MYVYISWPMLMAAFALSWAPMLLAGWWFKQLFRRECAGHAARVESYAAAEASIKAHADRMALIDVKSTLRDLQAFCTPVDPEERREAFRLVEGRSLERRIT